MNDSREHDDRYRYAEGELLPAFPVEAAEELAPSSARRFRLQRHVDSSGVSGTGHVADGVEFPDGVCAMHWAVGIASTSVFASVRDLLAIHGHSGDTRVVWAD